MKRLTGVRLTTKYGHSSHTPPICVYMHGDPHVCVPLYYEQEAMAAIETIMLHEIYGSYLRDLKHCKLMIEQDDGYNVYVLGAELSYKGEYQYIRATKLHTRYGMSTPWLPGDHLLCLESFMLHAWHRYCILTATN